MESKYSYEDIIYDIFIELEIIENLIENNPKQAISNIRHLKTGLRRALYPKVIVNER